MPDKSTALDIEEVVDIVATASGSLVGRTRLQKLACMLTMSGLSDNFSFVYKHYGPFSQELASAAELATLFSNLTEEQKRTQWGSSYSVFSTQSQQKSPKGGPREEIVLLARDADAIELELAATAAFLAYQGVPDPWRETANRKPDKATNERLDRAKALYSRFLKVKTPKPLPQI